MITLIVAILALVVGFAVGHGAGGTAVVADVEAELAKVEVTASTDVKALAAKIKALL